MHRNIHKYTGTYTNTQEHTQIHRNIHKCTGTYSKTQEHTQTHRYIHKDTGTYTKTQEHTQRHRNIHKDTGTHTDTGTYTDTQAQHHADTEDTTKIPQCAQLLTIQILAQFPTTFHQNQRNIFTNCNLSSWGRQSSWWDPQPKVVQAVLGILARRLVAGHLHHVGLQVLQGTVQSHVSVTHDSDMWQWHVSAIANSTSCKETKSIRKHSYCAEIKGMQRFPLCFFVCHQLLPHDQQC